MDTFYSPHLADSEVSIFGQEAKHLQKVLRKNVGDEIFLTDGMGAKHRATILSIEKDQVKTQIVERTVIPKPLKTHLVIAPPAKPARREWMIEKLTELGATEITLIRTARSGPGTIKRDRLDKILIGALKQSQIYHLPILNLRTLEEFILKQEQEQGNKFVAYCWGEDRGRIGKLLEPKVETTCLIGPEGDFTEGEVEKLKELGYKGISLGNQRMRTETAAIVACNLIKEYNVA